MLADLVIITRKKKKKDFFYFYFLLFSKKLFFTFVWTLERAAADQSIPKTGHKQRVRQPHFWREPALSL